MLYIPRKYYEEIIDHLKAALPNEGCGLLAGSGGKIAKHYPATNAEHSPVLYSIGSQELLRYLQEIESQDWDLLAIYHSHTHSQAYPSATDVKLAYYPDSITLIVSLQDVDHPIMRGFGIVDGVINEEEITLDHPASPRA